MTELSLVAPPAAATTGLNGEAIADLVGRYRTPLGEYLGASVSEGFWGTLLGQARSVGRVTEAEALAKPEDLRPIDEAEYKTGEFHRPGLEYQPGITVAAARERARIHDEMQQRRAVLAARDAGVLDQVLGFGAGVIGGLPTPENFLPFGGPALAVARAGRFGARLRAVAAAADAARVGGIGARVAAGAGIGAVDGLLGSAIVMPLTLPSRELRR